MCPIGIGSKTTANTCHATREPASERRVLLDAAMQNVNLTTLWLIASLRDEAAVRSSRPVTWGWDRAKFCYVKGSQFAVTLLCRDPGPRPKPLPARFGRPLGVGQRRYARFRPRPAIRHHRQVDLASTSRAQRQRPPAVAGTIQGAIHRRAAYDLRQSVRRRRPAIERRAIGRPADSPPLCRLHPGQLHRPVAQNQGVAIDDAGLRPIRVHMTWWSSRSRCRTGVKTKPGSAGQNQRRGQNDKSHPAGSSAGR